jgi:hypothetical protein
MYLLINFLLNKLKCLSKRQMLPKSKANLRSEEAYGVPSLLTGAVLAPKKAVYLFSFPKGN